MLEIIGWTCTILVLLGYFLNASGNVIYAMITWIIGDIGWIYYDVQINNYSHAVLCTIIIGINIFGYLRNKKLEINNAHISEKSTS